MSLLKDRIPVCKHGTKENLDVGLLQTLGKLEKNLEEELDYTSGYRCPECNLKAGGVKNSAHLRGLGVDIRCHESHTRCKIIKGVVELGIRRFGIGKNIIHVDVDISLPQDVLWLY